MLHNERRLMCLGRVHLDPPVNMPLERAQTVYRGQLDVKIRCSKSLMALRKPADSTHDRQESVYAQ